MNYENRRGEAPHDESTGERSLALTSQELECIARATPGGADNVEDVHPLSPLQEGMLFHRLLNSERDTYVLSTLLEVEGEARLEDLSRALQAVMTRHATLRSAVLWEQLSRPLQVVHREAPLPVHRFSLAEDQEIGSQLRAWMSPLYYRFELQTAPLLRLEAASDPSTGQLYAVLRIHHLICDHQSLKTLLAETFAHLDDEGGVLPPSRPFKEHVLETLKVPTQDGEHFFRRKLADVDEPTAPYGILDVYGDGTFVEEAHERLDAQRARRIRETARRCGVSPARLVHAAWALVIAHTSNRDDLVFGTVVLPRRMRANEARSTIGMRVSTLPLRLRLGEHSAGSFIRHVNDELEELLRHEHASLSVAQSCSGIEGAAPLFTALLNYRRGGTEADAGFPDARGIRVVRRTEAWTNYPVTLTFDDLADGFMMTAHADRRIGASRTLDHMRTALQSLVDALANDADVPVRTLAILSEQERRQVVELFNATYAPVCGEALVHELFEAQVRNTPGAIAVTHNGRSLTYSELNSKANKLASHLIRNGLCPDRLIGLCVERSIEMIVGILGVLKAGGGYLPLDPTYPVDRLQYMLDDAAPSIVLTQSSLRAALPRTEAVVFELDRLLSPMDYAREENPSPESLGLMPHHVVYAIYTSGSTGRPKGTAMPHAAMVNLMEWHRNALPTLPGERVLQFAALSFDVAFQEIFSTLTAGGTLVLLDERVRKDAQALMSLLNTEAVARLFVPPLMLQSLAEHCRVAGVAPRNLKDVITAGEQLRVTPDVVRMFEQIGGCRLHNHYGPTETHVVTALTLPGAPATWPAVPTIGRPIGNSRIYVLDHSGQPAPVGVAGEIYIAGRGIARGYLNRPELTAARFIADPFAACDGARMYKTGDLARWRSDGSIEYLGRNDDQVKIRGYRVELGEIEAALLRAPQVKEAAVVVLEHTAGQRRLVAYVTARALQRPSSEQLRAQLQEVLPQYMVPSAFVVLAALPLTSSGKLNRRGLPPPDQSDFLDRTHEPPEGDTEKRLAAVWQELLNVQTIGRRDGFFELGGDSLASMRLTVRIADSFGVMLQLGAIFAHSDLCDMARVIDSSHPGTRPISAEIDERMEEGSI